MASTLRELFERKRTGKFKPTTPSKRAEVRYREGLFMLIKGLKQNLQNNIKAFMTRNPNASEAQIFEYITQLVERTRRVDILKFATATAGIMATLVNRQNKKQIIDSLQNNSGVNIESLLNDTPVKDKLDEYIAQNVSLINSIKNDYLTDVEKQVRDNFLQNGRVEKLADVLQERYGVAKSRARLIARDQTNKLNAELSQERSQSLGLKFYIWQTSHDERVRKTHANMDGLMCRYDDDSVYSNDNGKTWKKRKSDMPKVKPGIEIQCRCNAVSVFKDDE